MSEPIEKHSGFRTPVSPRNHVLDGGVDPLGEGAILKAKKGRPIVKYGTLCDEPCKNG